MIQVVPFVVKYNSIDHYEKQYKQRILKNMKKKAKQLGFKLVEVIENSGEKNNAVISTT